MVEQFLNTLDERTFSRHGETHVGGDELSSVAGLSVWLEERGLATPGRDLRPADLAAARALRGALRGALSHSPDDAGRAVEALAAFPVRLAADSSGRLRLTSASGVPGLDVVVEAVAVAVAGGRWTRLRLCASADCRWAFYDTSRSGAGRGCSMEVCGNRHKTRAYRRRRAD